MYSVVLMAALTAGGQTTGWHGHGSCSGCYGGYSSCSGGCYGGSWGSCHGCWGGGYGSCYGNGYGSCYGNFGVEGLHGNWGASGYYGSYYPWDYSSSGCQGCQGCQGCSGVYGAVSPYFPTVPPVGTVAPPPAADETLPPPVKPGTESLAPSKARLIVEAPADAKLFIDDRPMKARTERRTYQTPDLEPGQTYFYEVRVEMERDGKPLSETKRVLLKAGQEVRADFKDMDTTSTAKAK